MIYVGDLGKTVTMSDVDEVFAPHSDGLLADIESVVKAAEEQWTDGEGLHTAEFISEVEQGLREVIEERLDVLVDMAK